MVKSWVRKMSGLIPWVDPYYWERFEMVDAFEAPEVLVPTPVPEPRFAKRTDSEGDPVFAHPLVLRFGFQPPNMAYHAPTIDEHYEAQDRIEGWVDGETYEVLPHETQPLHPPVPEPPKPRRRGPGKPKPASL